MGADEAGAAGDANALAGQSHESSPHLCLPLVERERSGERTRLGAGSGACEAETVSRAARRSRAGRRLLPGAFERRDDHQVVLDLLVLGDRQHRHAEKLVPPLLASKIATGSMPDSLQRQIGQFGGFAAAVDGDALAGRRALLQRLAQVLPHLAVEVQRVVHELVGQPRLLGDAARRDQVGDAVGLHVDALDVALADQPLQVDVRRARARCRACSPGRAA